MEGVRLTISIIIAVILQWTLRNIAEPFVYIDFSVDRGRLCSFAAQLDQGDLVWHSQRDSGSTPSAGGLLGANGFSKTLVAYIVSEIARRVYLDNLILRIPVLAGACLLNSVVYFGMHRLLGQTLPGDPLVSRSHTRDRDNDRRHSPLCTFPGFFDRQRPPKKEKVFTRRRQTADETQFD
jgi:hypothetical protein